MSSSENHISKFTPANIFEYAFLGFCVVFTAILMVVMAWKFHRKRRLAGSADSPQNTLNNDSELGLITEQEDRDVGLGRRATYPYAVGANGTPRNRHATMRGSTRFMTKDQIDSQFPIQHFAEAKQASKLYSDNLTQEPSQSTTEKMITSSPAESKVSLELNNHLDDNPENFKTENYPYFYQHDLGLHFEPKHQSLILLNKRPQDSLFSSLKWLHSDSHFVNNHNTNPNNQIEDYKDIPKLSPNTLENLDTEKFGRQLEEQKYKFRHSMPILETEHSYNNYPISKQESEKKEIQHAVTSTVTKIALDTLDPENDLLTCAICIEDMQDNDWVRGLSCGHIFHAKCIEPWLLSKSSCCPLCKRDFYVLEPIQSSNSGQSEDQQQR